MSRMNVEGGRRQRASRPRASNAAGVADGQRVATAFTAYRFADAEIGSSLVNGRHATELEAYFGEAAYADLRALARQAESRAVRGGPRVLILPGIMGSTLGVARRVMHDVI